MEMGELDGMETARRLRAADAGLQLVFGPLWLLLRRRLPREPVVLSRRLWKLVLGLAAMPLCALIAVVLLTFRITSGWSRQIAWQVCGRSTIRASGSRRPRCAVSATICGIT